MSADVTPARRTPGEITAAVVRELDGMGQRDTPFGALAVVLALAMDNAGNDSAGFVACGRELRATLAEVRRRAPSQPDELESLRRRRNPRWTP